MNNSATASATIAPLLRAELAKRLEHAPLGELVRLLADSERPPAPQSTPPEGRPVVRQGATVRSLVRKVLGRGSMHSQEVVAAVQALRPGTPGPTVRSDLSRMRVEGELRAVGPVRGGKLRVAR